MSTLPEIRLACPYYKCEEEALYWVVPQVPELLDSPGDLHTCLKHYHLYSSGWPQ